MRTSTEARRRRSPATAPRWVRAIRGRSLVPMGCGLRV